MTKWLVSPLLAMSVLGAACVELPPLVCKSDKVCITRDELQGVCIEAPNKVKYCAFPVTDCPSMWRWETAAGDYALQCVPPDRVPPDAGADALPNAADAAAG